MRSLTVRIFLSFWAIIVLLIGLAALAGFAYAERLREAVENFEIDDSAIAASAALETGGRDALEDWLRDRPAVSPLDVFIVDDEGRDLLGRALPQRVARMLRRLESGRRRWHSRRDGPPNLRPPAPLPQLIGPDGAIYSLFVSPKQNPWREWISERAGPAFFAIALLISAAVSYALAYAIARPVRTFREATVSIAEGKLDTRVASSMSNRRDEIGMLALDLDAMAGKLENAADQQTELTRNISHELRSPLARMRVALELARRQAGDLPEFSRIDRETERLDDLIGQILSYSRLKSRDDEPAQPLDLDELLHAVVEDANFECRSSGTGRIKVEYQCDKSGIVRGHAGALTSAFENVLRNAIRHSPDGGIVSVHATAGARQLVVTIEDQGSGVADEALERIFEPFFRAPDSDATGTGLGLAIARRAVQKNGGQIDAARAQSGGLRIEISLPVDGQDV